MLGIVVAAVAAVSPLTWKSTSLDLGEVQAGESIPVSFEFTNESDEPVTILGAKGSCGCTEVSHPKAAIAPGESAEISAKFSSKKAGAFKKNIKITTSASDEPIYLYFSGEVVE